MKHLAASLVERLTSVPTRKRIEKTWQRFSDSTVTFLKILPFVLIGILLYQYFHERVIIKPLSVPKALSDEGLTDVVAAEELRQRIYATVRRASLDDRAARGIALAPELPDIAVPGTGVTIDTIFDVLAAVLPWNTRTVISGGFTNDAGALELTVYVDGKLAYPDALSPRVTTIHKLLDGASDAVVAQINPVAHAYDLVHRASPLEAQRFVTRMIDLAPTENGDVAQAHVLRGSLMHEAGDFSGACAEFAKALQIDPAGEGTHLGLSALLADEGRPDLAVAEARKAVFFTWGRDWLSYYDLGERYDKMLDFDEAERAYRNAIALNFESPLAHDALGEILTKDERYSRKNVAARENEALAEFDKALDLEEDHDKFLLDRGSLEIEMKQWVAAQRDYTVVDRAEPQSEAAHYGLGIVFSAQGLPDRAASEFLEALRLRPDDGNARRLLERSLKNEARVRSSERAMAAVSAAFDGPDACRGSRVVTGDAIDGALLEVVKTRCPKSRAVAMTRSQTNPACNADPAEGSPPEQVAAVVRMVPAMTMYYGFVLRDWLGGHAGQLALTCGAGLCVGASFFFRSIFRS